MTTQLGIITNYKGDSLTMDPALTDPREIQLEKCLGITNASTEPIKDNLPEQVNLTATDTNDFILKNYFKDKFDTFNKLSTNTVTGPTKSMPYPWSRKFVVNKLIIIYLEANKDNDDKWNTEDNNDNNRIYLFDDAGNELKTPGDMTKEGESETKFFRIKIERNVLSIIKDDKTVPFAVIDAAAMTLAKLISTLLGQEIEYKNNANDQGPYQPQLQKAEPFQSSSAAPVTETPVEVPPVRLGSAPVGTRNPSRQPQIGSSDTTNPEGIPRPSSRVQPLLPPDYDSDEEVFPRYGGKGKKSRKKQRNGGKKSRKQSKGGKKSRKQRKSLRKNKRSRSKK